jgi:hypothetical protein
MSWTETNTTTEDKTMNIKPNQTAQLMERLHELWAMGDAAILSDYQAISEEELWSTYGWAADLPGDLFAGSCAGCADKDAILSGLKAINQQLAAECDRLRKLVKGSA